MSLRRLLEGNELGSNLKQKTWHRWTERSEDLGNSSNPHPPAGGRRTRPAGRTGYDGKNARRAEKGKDEGREGC